MIDVIIAIFLLLGCCLFLVSSIGIFRLPDSFTRMHALAKSSSLGIGFILVSVCFHFTSSEAVIRSILIVIFIFLTTPIAAQVLSRAAYLRSDKKNKDVTIDELKNVYRD